MSDARVLHREIVFEGKRLKVRVDRIVEPAGHEAVREIVDFPDCVCVVARPTPDEVLLIRQYRHATNGDLLEIPAGGIDEGEDPRDAAIRELEEETGYRAGSVTERARFWTTPGFSTEFMYLFEASQLVKTEIRPDDDEVIEVQIVRRDEVLRMIDDGRIQDAKSILGLLRVLK